MRNIISFREWKLEHGRVNYMCEAQERDPQSMGLLCLDQDLLIGPDDNRITPVIALSLVTLFFPKELLTDHKISSGYKRSMAT